MYTRLPWPNDREWIWQSWRTKNVNLQPVQVQVEWSLCSVSSNASGCIEIAKDDQANPLGTRVFVLWRPTLRNPCNKPNMRVLANDWCLMTWPNHCNFRFLIVMMAGSIEPAGSSASFITYHWSYMHAKGYLVFSWVTSCVICALLVTSNFRSHSRVMIIPVIRITVFCFNGNTSVISYQFQSPHTRLSCIIFVCISFSKSPVDVFLDSSIWKTLHFPDLQSIIILSFPFCCRFTKVFALLTAYFYSKSASRIF